jgi:hypothetical protein
MGICCFVCCLVLNLNPGLPPTFIYPIHTRVCCAPSHRVSIKQGECGSSDSSSSFSWLETVRNANIRWHLILCIEANNVIVV